MYGQRSIHKIHNKCAGDDINWMKKTKSKVYRLWVFPIFLFPANKCLGFKLGITRSPSPFFAAWLNGFCAFFATFFSFIAICNHQVFFLILKKKMWTNVLLWGHWYFSSELLVMSPLGFKTRVGRLIRTWQRCMWCMIPEIHLWCDTCWPLDGRSLFSACMFQQRQDVGLKRETCQQMFSHV